MNNKITIKQANNGFIIEHEEDWSTEDKKDIRIEKEVIEDNDDDNESMKNLLIKVAEHFGVSYDKWGEENINITFDRKGYKLE